MGNVPGAWRGVLGSFGVTLVEYLGKGVELLGTPHGLGLDALPAVGIIHLDVFPAGA